MYRRVLTFMSLALRIGWNGDREEIRRTERAVSALVWETMLRSIPMSLMRLRVHS